MSVKEATGESAEESVSAFPCACSCLYAAALAGCPEHQHHATAMFGQIDRLAADAPGPLGGLAAGEDSYSALPCLCLSGAPGPVARGTVSGPRLSAETKLFAVLTLRFSEGEELFAQSAISALEFSPGADSVAWALSSRR